MRVVVLASTVIGFACAQNTAVAPRDLIKVPPSAATAGDALMAFAPAGADGVVELDLARLRQNPVMSPVMARLAAMADGAGALAAVDAVLLCAYQVGTERAATLTLMRGAGPWGVPVTAGVTALGPPELVARAREVARGNAPPLAADREFLAVRARAMPAQAQGAAVRVAARLGFDARVDLAGRFDLDAVPQALSLWGDVADDLAVVATLSGTDPAEGAALARALDDRRERLTRDPWVRARYLHFTLRTIDITARGAEARVVFILGPRRLARFARLLERTLGPQPAETNPGTSKP